MRTCQTYTLRTTGLPGGAPASPDEGLSRSVLVRESEKLVELRINEGESFEAFLRRFTKRVQQESIISEARRRQHFEPPSVTRKKRAAAKHRKSVKATLKHM